MKCPVCADSTLAMSNRAGIEIDYCPSCRGVWLDRGELDKIIERTSVESSAPTPPPGTDMGGRRLGARYDDDDDDRYRDPNYRGRKRKGFLGDLFDFD